MTREKKEAKPTGGREKKTEKKGKKNCMCMIKVQSLQSG